jgi:RNA polymerase-binding transcription factor DksA
MKTADMERYRGQLLQLRARLSDDIDQQVENIQQIISRPGELSKIPAHAGNNDSEGLVREVVLTQTQESLLIQTDGALRRIEEGTFGTCEDCGQTINRERLDFMPFIPYCVECATRHESEEAGDEPLQG